MRCQVAPARDCPTAERCELEGCLEPYWKTGQAVARERQPIDLPALEDYQPGRIMRGLMALADRGEKVVRRGPTPFATSPAPAPEPPAMSISHSTLSPPPEAATPTPPRPAAPPAAALATELRIVEVPGPAWLVYVGDKPLGVTQRFERLGPVR